MRALGRPPSHQGRAQPHVTPEPSCDANQRTGSLVHSRPTRCFPPCLRVAPRTCRARTHQNVIIVAEWMTLRHRTDHHCCIGVCPMALQTERRKCALRRTPVSRARRSGMGNGRVLDYRNKLMRSPSNESSARTSPGDPAQRGYRSRWRRPQQEGPIVSLAPPCCCGETLRIAPPAIGGRGCWRHPRAGSIYTI